MATTNNRYAALLGVDEERLKSGGAAKSAASSSGFSMKDTSPQTLLSWEKELVRGMVQQHPEIVTNAHAKMTGSYNAAYDALQKGVTDRQQIFALRNTLDDVEKNITTMRELRQALGRDIANPELLDYDLKDAESGLTAMREAFRRQYGRYAAPKTLQDMPVTTRSGIQTPGILGDGVTLPGVGERRFTTEGTKTPLAEWDGREYNADNIEQNWSRIMALANADTLTSSQRKEAVKIASALNAAVRRENTFAKLLSGERDEQKVRDYEAVRELLQSKTTAQAIGTGFVASFPGAARLIDNAGVSMAEQGLLSADVAEAARRSRTADAQNASGIAYTAGQVAGNLAQLGAAGELAGGATAALDAAARGSKAAQLGVKALRSALTFGSVGGLQSIGEQDWRNDAARAALNVAKDTGIQAAAGAVGGIAEGLTSTGLARWLSTTGRMTPFWEFVRQTASGSAFGAGMTATEYALAEEKPTGKEIAADLVTAFLFSSLTGAVNSVRMSRVGKAYMDSAVSEIERDLRAMETHGGSAEEMQEAAERVLQYTQDLRTTISQNYYPGQQAYIERILGTLDGLDEVVRGRAAAAGSTVTPDNLLTGAANGTGAETVGAELPSSYLDSDNAPHTPEQESRIAEFKRAVDQKIVDFVKKVQGLSNSKYRSKIKQTISEVSERQANAVKDMTGVDVTGFKNMIDGDAVDHIIRRHGPNGSANTSMADVNDIGRIGYVLDNYDAAELLYNSDGSVTTSWKWRNSDGTPAVMLRFNKKIDGTMYVVEAAPDSAARNMAVVTAYMTKNTGAGTDQVYDAGNQPSTHVRNALDTVSPGAYTVAQPQAEVNSMENVPPVVAEVANQNTNGGTINEAGRDLLPDGNGRRNTGAGAGVEAGQIRSVENGSDRGAQAVRSESRPELHAEVWKSPEELNIPRGGKVPNLGIIAENGWTGAMRTAADMLRGLGYNVTYVMGPIDVFREDGRIRQVSGVIHGNNVIARADGRLISGEQNALHEYGHARIAEDPAIMQELKERFVQTHGEAEMNEIIARYAMIYDFTYGTETEGMTADEVAELYDAYLEEYIADAVGGISRVKLGRRLSAARDTGLVWDVLTARENQGSGDGVRGVRYALDEYSERQMENWKNSKKIIIYQNDAQLKDFVRKASTEGDYVGKMYFGTVGEALADEIERATGFDFLGRNITLRAGNVRKILKDHGIESREAQRGQRALTYDDFADIPRVISEPDSITASKYDGKPAVVFQKDRPAGRLTVFAVDSGGSLELFIQTMYSGKNKRSIAGMANANSLTFTSETTAGTTPESSISESSRNSNTKMRFSAAEDAGELGEDAYIAEQEGRLAASVEAMTPTELRRAVNRDRAEIAVLEKYAGRGDITDAQRRTLTELRQRLDAEQKRLGEENRKTREERQRIQQEKLEAQKRAAKRMRPKKAKQEFKRQVLDLFGAASGTRTALGEQADALFDDAYKNGRVDERARRRLFDNLLDAGMTTVAPPPELAALREAMEDVRIFVPDNVKAELGDDYASMRGRALGAGVILTSDVNANRIDSFTEELEERFPGMFRGLETDQTEALRRLLDLVEEGRSENVTAREMLQRVEDDTGYTVDEQLEDLERRFDQIIDKTLYAAGIETGLKGWHVQKIQEERAKSWETQQSLREQHKEWQANEKQRHLETELRQRERHKEWQDAEKQKHLDVEKRQRERYNLSIAKKRAERRAALERQAEQKALRELQHKTMNALRWLKKNRGRTDAATRAAWDEVLSDINLYTLSAANEMRWSDKYQAKYGDIADMYKKAKESDPNWMPSKELEKLVSMLDNKAIADMDVDALDTLYKAATALRTEFYNRNNVINDELHRTFSEVYHDSAEEIRASGGKGTLGEGLGKLTNAEMLRPMNLLRMMGGWKDGTWAGMAKQLQNGERDRKGYTTRAKALLDDFTESRKEWLRHADGQGKDAIWYEIEVPELMELRMGDKPIFGETVKICMTPLQKVQLYLESKNYQNLAHMTGGRTFVNRELYSQGKTSEALAQGTTVRLAPEQVKNLVKDLTEEEAELAGILERYYNGMAKEEINRVSNILYGYDKAMIDNYAPIFTDSNYNKTTAGLFDVTAEGVGHMKSREQISKNPSYNIGALDAFERHIDQTSRFVGLAIPIRNMETLTNWYGDGTTMKKTISQKWGGEAVKYIEDLMTELQSPTAKERGILDQLGDKAVSNYISAVFAMNPGIVFKQAASYPAAAAVLGFRNIPRPSQLRGVDEELIAKYTPELAYRKLGYGTPEAAELKNNPNILDRNKATRFLLRGGAITAMDAATVKSLWPWAENKVRREEPELYEHMGDRAAIDAGQSPYYKRVAEVFNEAVNETQPMYDVMNRAKIMNTGNLLTKTFTMFKTVPLQEYNTLRRYIAEARTAEGDGKKKATKAAAAAAASVLASTLMLESIEVLNALVKNGLKYYRDDDDELTAESFAQEYALRMAGDLAGIMIGGSELFDWITHILGAGGYSTDFSIIGADQINEMKDALEDAATLLQKTVGGAFNVHRNGGDVGAYLKRNRGDLLGGIHDIATVVAKYFGGLPVENVEKYLGGILARAWPEAKAAMEGYLDTTTKTDLSRIPAKELPERMSSLLAIRNIEAAGWTSAELARLYLAGHKGAVPADTPTKLDERELTAYEMQIYDNAYSDAIGKSLDKLVESDVYIEADDKGRERMLGMLYEYAGEKAKAAVDPGHEVESWVSKADEAAASGIDLPTYIDADQAKKAVSAANDGNSSITQAEAETALRGMDLTNEQRAVLWQLTNTGWKAENNPFAGGESKALDTAWTGGTAAPANTAPEVTAPSPTDQTYLNSLYDKIEPLPGRSEPTKTQKYRAIVDGFDSEDEQLQALCTVMSDSEMTKIRIGRSWEVTPEMYVASKEAMYAADDNGTVDQMEAKWALESMDLTNEQRAVLWQLANTSWVPYRNPFNSDIGIDVYKMLKGETAIPEATTQGTTAQEQKQPTFDLPAAGLRG